MIVRLDAKKKVYKKFTKCNLQTQNDFIPIFTLARLTENFLVQSHATIADGTVSTAQQGSNAWGLEAHFDEIAHPDLMLFDNAKCGKASLEVGIERVYQIHHNGSIRIVQRLFCGQ